MKRTLVPVPVVVLAFVISLVAGACGNVAPWAAKVNGVRIAQSALDDELRAIRNNTEFLSTLEGQGGMSVEGQARGTFDMVFVSRVLTRRIFFELIAQEVERRGLEVTDTDIERAREDASESFGGPTVFDQFPEAYREETVRVTASINVLQADLGRDTGTPEEIAAYYDEHREEFQDACVSHILVDDRGEADALKAQLDQGADFAALAREHSLDNQGATGGSAAEGGSLGCLSPAQTAGFVGEFRDGVEAATVGVVTDPVETQFGFHLILVTERRQLTLEDAAPQIQQRIAGDTQASFNDLLSARARSARIEVNPRYGQFDANEMAVIPPDAPSQVTTTIPGVLPFDPGL